MSEVINRQDAPSVPAEEMLLLQKSIRRIVRANDLGSRSLQKTYGLTAPQLAVLTAVGPAGEMSTTKIALQVDLSAATVVTILDNLERQELVTRHRSSEDRRVVYTRLTKEGAAVLARTHGPFGDSFARKIAALPATHRRQLLESIATLADLMSVPEPVRAD